MSVRSEVLLWAQRVTARARDAGAHVLLEIKVDATVEEAQDAFHKVARTSHPDLHRASLTPEELELVTTAYARVAGAYQDFRSKRAQTTRIRTLKDEGTSDRIPAVRPPGKTPEGTPPIARPVTQPGIPTSTASGTVPGVSAPMNSKAMLYYRKATLCLRQGDLKTAVLNMKMAIAGDPHSAFLRDALAEIEAAIAQKK